MTWWPIAKILNSFSCLKWCHKHCKIKFNLLTCSGWVMKGYSLIICLVDVAFRSMNCPLCWNVSPINLQYVPLAKSPSLAFFSRLTFLSTALASSATLTFVNFTGRSLSLPWLVIFNFSFSSWVSSWISKKHTYLLLDWFRFYWRDYVL